MKKFLLIFGIVFSILLPSCSGNNECVKQIASIINKAASVGAGTSTDADKMFIRPGGNVFANEDIKAIIKENMNYKLTDQDKEMLTSAINALLPDNSALEYEAPGTAGAILLEMRNAERKKNLTNIEAATTLGDLL